MILPLYALLTKNLIADSPLCDSLTNIRIYINNYIKTDLHPKSNKVYLILVNLVTGKYIQYYTILST